MAFEVTCAEGTIRLNSENEAYGWFDKIPYDSVYNCVSICKAIKIIVDSGHAGSSVTSMT